MSGRFLGIGAVGTMGSMSVRRIFVLATLATVLAALSGCAGAPSNPGDVGGGGGAVPSIGWHRAEVAFPFAVVDALPSLDSGSGQQVGQARAKPFVINMWASWCGPCRFEMPFMERLNRADKVPVVGISRDVSAASARALISTTGVRYPNVLDTHEKAAVALRSAMPLQGLPSTAIVVNGKVTWVHVGTFNSFTALRRGVLKRLHQT